ncbi:MAG TPA: hypothetical protein VFV95_01650 [Vicinamibacterales bacterium]|nr:hypothetical protein [Vicinamibacterales bacterium]
MAVSRGTLIGPYEISDTIGAGGPAYARAVVRRERRRGLAAAKEART